MTGIIQGLLAGFGGVISDAYFNLVTLLLPGNGTNGAQNNTFLDSSTNNFTITRNGNTTQGTFSPFSQTGWSNYFNGTNSDAIEIPNNAVFNFGTSDVTVEAWVYLNATNAIQNLIDCGPSSGSGFTSWTLDIDASGYIRFGSYVSGTNQQVSATSNALSPNQWYHIAFTRASGTNRLFVNGALCTSTGTFTQAIDSGGNTVLIGRGKYSGFTRPTTGYFSNVRITKGGALYTAAFTPSTTSLTTTVSAGTVSLLTCQSNRFIDNSVNAFAVTVLATPSVQAFSPFLPTAAYSAATVGGSGYFDGTGDYLTLPSSSNLAFDTGDFCVEFWLYRTGTTGGLYSNAVNSGGGDAQFEIQLNGTNKVILIGWNTTFMTGATTINANTWYHIAVVRSGTSMAIFVNGTRDATATSANNFSSTNAFVIGAQAGGAGTTIGYISSLRSVKGAFVYNPSSTTVTIPTAPVTAITNTQLLLNFTNAGITDATAKNDLETVGNAQISTTQSKFGGSSMYFDGTGDYLSLPASPLLNVSGGRQFTVECWIYTSSTARQNVCIDTASAQYWDLCIDNLKVNFRYNNAGVSITSSASITSGAWNHIAVCWTGSAMRIFINGTMDSANSATSMTAHADAIMILGYSNYAPDPQWMNGYIDDFRITNGLARYTGNFTAPTAAFPLQ